MESVDAAPGARGRRPGAAADAAVRHDDAEPRLHPGLRARACGKTAGNTPMPRSGPSWRCAELGDGDRATELFAMLNPINHARTWTRSPATAPNPTWSPPMSIRSRRIPGRGGWTWYTGSAGWMYRVGIESILGLTPRATVAANRPVHPADVAAVRSDHQAPRRHLAPRRLESRWRQQGSAARHRRRRRAGGGRHPADRRWPGARSAGRAGRSGGLAGPGRPPSAFAKASADRRSFSGGWSAGRMREGVRICSTAAAFRLKAEATESD